MRVITVIQPWATLLALGEKKFETRPRRTHIRGDLAIHAGKKVVREACLREPIRSILAKHGYTADNLPTGVIIFVVNLFDCHVVHADHSGDAVLLNRGDAPAFWIGKDSNEFHFGDFSPGRHAWRMEDVREIEPIPARGQQGFWNWTDGQIKILRIVEGTNEAG